MFVNLSLRWLQAGMRAIVNTYSDLHLACEKRARLSVNKRIVSGDVSARSDAEQ